MGEVVTRFPPEPSGYLHVGHAKAAMLNQYFARAYKGKLLIRFDDTNPANEKEEFATTIMEDLQMMEIVGDMVSHSSDFFDVLAEHAVKIITSGNAYADDTEGAIVRRTGLWQHCSHMCGLKALQMKQERFDGIASQNRNKPVAENLAIFEEMKRGTVEGQRWCIRAKISYDDVNKALRDPVIYRCNVANPHHRTG
jgi:glutamyl-tRNA synthetase